MNSGRGLARKSQHLPLYTRNLAPEQSVSFRKGIILHQFSVSNLKPRQHYLALTWISRTTSIARRNGVVASTGYRDCPVEREVPTYVRKRESLPSGSRGLMLGRIPTDGSITWRPTAVKRQSTPLACIPGTHQECRWEEPKVASTLRRANSYRGNRSVSGGISRMSRLFHAEPQGMGCGGALGMP